MKRAVQSILGRLTGANAVREWTRGQLRTLDDRVKEARKAGTRALEQSNHLRHELSEQQRRVSGLADAVTPLAGVLEQVGMLEGRLARLERFSEASDRVALRFSSAPPDVHDIAAICEHARRAILAATLDTDPAPHVVVDNFLPDSYYDLLVDTLPPPDLFEMDDAAKQDFHPFGAHRVPVVSRVVWQRFERDAVAQAITQALLSLFASAIVPHYAAILGDQLAPDAARLPMSASGRVMLRRPGYRLPPHVDPKRRLITGILYLARPGDSEAYGTQLYRVDRPFASPVMATYYPEKHGFRCELAKQVAFRPNRLLAFINSGAAHGAEIPVTASKSSERYAYQFAIRPAEAELRALLRRLPASRREEWRELLTDKTAAKGATDDPRVG